MGGNKFAGGGNSNVSGGGGNNRNRNRGNRRPDTGYGAPRFKKSLMNNGTASFLDLIETRMNKGDEKEIHDYYY